jgi:hypothetical protein
MRKLAGAVVVAVALAAATSLAHAATTIVRDIPFSADVVCGETIHLDGTIMGVFTETATPSGGFMVSFHFQPQGLTGVGSVSGRTYHGTGLTREITVFSPPGGFTDTFVNRFHIVGTGGNDSIYTTATVHLTVSPSGEITASFENTSSTCD